MEDKISEKCHLPALERVRVPEIPTNQAAGAHYNAVCKAMSDSRGAAAGLPKFDLSGIPTLEEINRKKPPEPSQQWIFSPKVLEELERGAREIKERNRKEQEARQVHHSGTY